MNDSAKRNLRPLAEGGKIFASGDTSGIGVVIVAVILSVHYLVRWLRPGTRRLGVVTGR